MLKSVIGNNFSKSSNVRNFSIYVLKDKDYCQNKVDLEKEKKGLHVCFKA